MPRHYTKATATERAVQACLSSSDRLPARCFLATRGLAACDKADDAVEALDDENYQYGAANERDHGSDDNLHVVIPPLCDASATAP